MQKSRFPSPVEWIVLIGLLTGGWPACRSGMPRNATVIRLDVPFIAQQTDRDCGRTSLRIVLRYFGIALDPDDLGRPEGVLPFEIEQYLRDHNISYTRVHARPETLLNVLSDGRPVLLLLNLSTGPWQRYHYVVLVGAIVRKGQVHAWQIHDGRTPYRTVSARWLWSHWAGAYFWGVVMNKPRGHGETENGDSLRDSEIRNRSVVSLCHNCRSGL